MRCLMLPKIKFSFLCVNRGRWMKSLNTDRNRTGKDGQQTESPLMQENELHQGGLFIVSRQERRRSCQNLYSGQGLFALSAQSGAIILPGRNRTAFFRRSHPYRG